VNIDQLVRMANEIASFFISAADEGEAANSVAAHIKSFWDPRMRAQIVAHYRAGGAGLEAQARQAIARLAENPRPSENQRHTG